MFDDGDSGTEFIYVLFVNYRIIRIRFLITDLILSFGFSLNSPSRPGSIRTSNIFLGSFKGEFGIFLRKKTAQETNKNRQMQIVNTALEGRYDFILYKISELVCSYRFQNPEIFLNT
ncbi:hypothetical protein LEP1GSC170_6307 [Leptospira interrogans serovar Bataviae str. HAI135]|nr:hypothetical protein LEP1GSC170_6307 [Leptospira interrogans serovar Bataviae str. HAI135]